MPALLDMASIYFHLWKVKLLFFNRRRLPLLESPARWASVWVVLTIRRGNSTTAAAAKALSVTPLLDYNNVIFFTMKSSSLFINRA
jgi:hypothetical protein